MKVAIIGGTGYAAVELLRLLNSHPFVEVGSVYSSSQAGSPIADSYPHVTRIVANHLQPIVWDEVAENHELVFLATPHSVSKELVPKLLSYGLVCIDLSGAFRLKSATSYEDWYQDTSAPQEYLQQATYGLSEIYEQEIKASKLVANPGCYPTASLLGLMPAIKANLIDLDSIIIDAKSGVSGAGRGVAIGTHYSEINENLRAYKLGVHQHIPEIEQILSEQAGESPVVTFTTHLVPMTRGIMCTIHANLLKNTTTEKIISLYEEFYHEKPFIRIRKPGVYPATKEVSGSNFCDIGAYVDPRTNRLTVISAIDNLVKGAAGQAIQNMNLQKGWEITTGLWDIPLYP